MAKGMTSLLLILTKVQRYGYGVLQVMMSNSGDEYALVRARPNLGC